MRMLVAPLALATATGLVALPARVHAGESEDLLRALSDAERRITNFSFTMEMSCRTMVAKTGRLGEPTARTTTVTFDDRGRFRYESKYQSRGVNGKLLGTGETRGAYDGETYKEESISNGAKTGALDASPDGVGWALHPRECLTHFVGEYASAEMARTGIDTISTHPTNRDILIVTGKPVTAPDKVRQKYRFEVDRRNGFRTPRKEALVAREGSEEWIVYGSTVSEGYREVEQNIWVPEKVSTVLTSVTSLASAPNPVQVFATVDATISRPLVNRSLPADTFSFRYSDGILIHDRKSNTQLRTATKPEGDLARVVEGGEKLYLQEELKSSTNRWWYLALAAGCATLSVIALFVYRSRRRRSKASAA